MGETDSTVPPSGAEPGSAAGVGPPRRGGRAIAVILIASLAFKLALLLWIGDIAPVADEIQYVVAGESIAAGHGIRYTNPKWDPLYQPPVYPHAMALAFELGGGPFELKLFQVLLSTLTVWLLFLLTRDWFGARTAVWSAAIFAFYPTLVAFTHYTWSETFFVFWLVAAFYFLFEPGRRIARPASLLLAGLLLGVAAQTRAVAVYLVPCLVPLVYLSTRSFRGTLTRSAALFLGVTIALAPLTYSIYERHGGFLLISTQPAKIWHESYNSKEPENVDYRFEFTRRQPRLERPRSLHKNPIVQHREETRNALAFMAENPLLCVKRFYTRLTYLFNPSSFLVRHLRNGWYDTFVGEPAHAPIPRPVVEVIVAVAVASYLLVATLGLVGLFTMPPGVVRAFSVGLILFFVMLTALTYATSRYRVPFLPVLIPSAAFALTNLRACLGRLRAPTRLVPFALVYALLVYWWSLYLHLNWE